jgi:cytochrome c556
VRDLIAKLFIVLSIAGFAINSFADEAENVIKYRQSVMKAIGGHMSATALIVQGKASFADDLGEHAQALATMLAKAESLFPEGSDFGETRAKDSVWSKPAEFKKVAKDSADAAAEFLKVVKAGNKAEFPKMLGALGDSCKACHKDFRLKKE